MCTKTYRRYCRYYLLEIHTLVTLTVTCLLRPIKRYLSLPSRFIRLYLPPFGNVLVYKRLFKQDYFLTIRLDIITQCRNAFCSILLHCLRCFQIIMKTYQTLRCKGFKMFRLVSIFIYFMKNGNICNFNFHPTTGFVSLYLSLSKLEIRAYNNVD